MEVVKSRLDRNINCGIVSVLFLKKSIMQPQGHERRKEDLDEGLRRVGGRSFDRESSFDGLDPCDSGSQLVAALRIGAAEEVLAAATTCDTPERPERTITPEQRGLLFDILSNRVQSDNDTDHSDDGIQWFFRHPIDWSVVQRSLEAAGDAVLYGILKMEENGHEVGVIIEKRDGKKGYRFDSRSKESPIGKRGIDFFEAKRIAEEEWGVSLMWPEVADELALVDLISNELTEDYLETRNPGTPEEPRSVFLFHHGRLDFTESIGPKFPTSGFRCSVWIPEVS